MRRVATVITVTVIIILELTAACEPASLESLEERIISEKHDRN